MPTLTLLQGALLAMSLLFGGLGIFFLYYSFALPELGGYALLFLGAASGIAFFMQQGDPSRK
jgi:hypothetical protein